MWNIMLDQTAVFLAKILLLYIQWALYITKTKQFVQKQLGSASFQQIFLFWLSIT